MKLYENHYTKLGFERAGLFKVIRDRYRCRDVLYPGCSVHVTPSLYFPHVVYVDQSQAAAAFFTDQGSISEFVNRGKLYKQSAYVRFIQQEYSQPLPLQEGKFDLLLALFAGGIAQSCARYLKPGGLLLTNDHQDDAVQAVHQPGLKIKALIKFQKGNYKVLEENRDEQLIRPQKSNHRYLRQSDKGVEYIENELYYVFVRELAA